MQLLMWYIWWNRGDKYDGEWQKLYSEKFVIYKITATAITLYSCKQIV